MKKFVVYLIITVFTSIAWSETTTVLMKINDIQIENNVNSVSINMEGYGTLTAPGSYRLPHKRVNIILPPNAVNISWKANYSKETMNSPKFPEKNPPFYGDKKYLSSNYDNHEKEHIKYVGVGHWGDVAFARFDVLPYTFNENACTLENITDLSIDVNYTFNGKTASNRIPPSINGNEGQFLNPEALRLNYHDTGLRNFDYLIITKQTLFPALLPLIQFHQQQGMQVQMVSVDSIRATQQGFNDAEKVRNYLVSLYITSPFTYLLLVGDVDTIPIQYLGPEPNSTVLVPSDFYYSDLSSDFDTDNDGILGEYSMGNGDEDYGIDFTPELYVGRIPFNDSTRVNQVEARIIAFENTTADWKNHVLIPGAILNYAQENGNPWLMTNNDIWGEFAKTHIFNSNDVTTMYEQEGLVTSMPSDYPLNQDELTNLLNTNSYGIVDWAAHGSSVSSSRKLWVEDTNLDSIPQNSETEWHGLVNLTTFDNLANQDGSVYFCASCNNGMLDMEGISLGETILQKKAVAAIAATRTGWGKIGWKNPGWGGLNSYNYYFLENYVNFHQTIGQSLGNMNFLYSNYFLFGDPVDSDGIIWPELQNIYTYLLFGDPAIGYQSDFITNDGEVLVWEPALNAHSSNLIQAIRSVSEMNVIYTDKLIPDYSYLNNFKAIFILSGFAENTYYFSNHPEESQLLSDYLDAGGKVYLEGDQFSGDMENAFIDKFMAIAPFSHLANIQSIYGFDLASGHVWNYTGYNLMNKPFMSQEDDLPIFKTAIAENSDIIGIYHQTDTYKTIASAFELNGLTGENPSINDMLHTIMFDYFDLDTSTMNQDNPGVAPVISVKTYPNPFYRTLNITVNTSKTGNVQIDVYNIRGQKVRNLHSGLVTKGKLDTSWDGKDVTGKTVGSGIYLIQMKTKDKSIITKTMFMN